MTAGTRVLLTGGRGYIGGRLAQDLSRRGAVPCLASRFPAPEPHWLPTAEAVSIDWNSAESLKACCSGRDAVVHLAGLNAPGSASDPGAALLVNGVHTARLLQAAIASGVSRFVYFSTAHVYDNPLSGAIDESYCPRNLHPYATSHRAGEDVVREAHNAGRIEGVVIRLANALGPPADAGADCWTLLLNGLAREAASTGRLTLRTTGLQQRDFIAMSDVCRMTAELLGLPRSTLGDGLFNMGGGKSFSVLEMANLLASRFALATGRPFGVQQPHPGAAEVSTVLQYDIDKLLGAGIQGPQAGALVAELDSLVSFCLAEVT